MRIYAKQGTVRLLIAIMACGCLLAPGTGQADTGPPSINADTNAQPVTLSVDQSSLLTFQDPIDRVSINNEKVAEVIVVSPTQILVHGKQSGSTSLIVWRADGSHLFTVNVVNAPQYKRGSFENLLHNMFPEEQNLKAYESDKTIILAGRAKHPANVNKAVAAAAAVAEHVVNITDLEDSKQVLIEVRIAEVERHLAHSLGIDYFAQSGRVTQAGFVGDALAPQTPATPQFHRLVDAKDILLSPAAKQLLELRGGSFDLSVAISALEQEGLVRILAEPNLLAMSGQEASFLAGGEFPIPVAQGNNAISVEFKEFGIRLKFKPEVTSDDMIRMAVTPEVSVLDSTAAAVTIAGFKVPGLITRRASTTVEMRSGESLVIGGLLSQTNTRSEDQVPFLGNIPILGKLFSSEKFRNEETELLVLVTPRLTLPSKVEVPQHLTDPGKIGEALKKPYNPDSPDEWLDSLHEAIAPSTEEKKPAHKEAP
ncbi:MAG: pilus assembly protein N-terminal domain-containing protein [Candidatus Omnitrophica bacterium]|nr:pilus assembly protein N-terminal domain-containing protein [Candidatus Omnitrophota bacterium]